MKISGKEISDRIDAETLKLVLSYCSSGRTLPKLVVIGLDISESSKTFVKKKGEKAENLSIPFEFIDLDKETGISEVLELIDKLNNDNSVGSIILQHPNSLTKLEERIALDRISYLKDVDCLSSTRIGMYTSDTTSDTLFPATALAVRDVILYSNTSVSGKTISVLGNSLIVGRPVSTMLSKMGATVITLNSHTLNISQYLNISDIIISAVGKKSLINSNVLNKRIELFIDVGISYENNKIYGDGDREFIERIADKYTPVPGGIGPINVSHIFLTHAKLSTK